MYGTIYKEISNELLHELQSSQSQTKSMILSNEISMKSP